MLPVCPFTRNGISSEVIARLVTDFYTSCKDPQKLLVTFGLEYKIDLKTFGGKGFTILDELYRLIHDENIRTDVFRENTARLFSWWAPKPAQKTYGNITACTICGAETEDVSKWFSKDGFYFATPGCFKKYLNSKRT